MSPQLDVVAGNDEPLLRNVGTCICLPDKLHGPLLNVLRRLMVGLGNIDAMIIWMIDDESRFGVIIMLTSCCSVLEFACRPFAVC